MNEMNPNTPVLVAAAAVQQREEVAGAGLEAYQLMVAALEKAAAEAQAPQLLTRAQRIEVPKGMWNYTDPARLVADAIGASKATTVLADIGILQQASINRACNAIASGELEVAIVTGAEAKYRALRGQIEGVEISETSQENAEADITLRPDAELWSEVESAAGLGMPVGFYAIMDSALRHAQGLSVGEHRDEMARTYAQFSEIAASNPDAWVGEALTADYIREGSAKNKMLAYPYTKLHNSQWNVDQAAALIFCSVAVAQEMGIDRKHWIFPLAGTESNAMSVMSARRELNRNFGFKVAGEKALSLAGKQPEDIDLMELYSCFPQAVRVQLQELNLPKNRPLSVTGAMTFGGGPLNNFVFQATVKMAQLLRANPGQTGLVTCVSGMNTKQGCALYSSEPNAEGWQFADVTEDVSAATELCEVVAEFEGGATIAGYTVLYQGDQPWRAVAVCDLPGGKRTAAYCEQAVIIDALLKGEYVGRTIAIAEGQFS
jgi:acetyl-CoA C-acetyltransferase